MKKTRFLTVALASILLISPLACRNTDGDVEGEGRGEHEGEHGGEHGGERGGEHN